MSRRYPADTPDYLPILKHSRRLGNSAAMWTVFGAMFITAALGGIALAVALGLGYRFKHIERVDAEWIYFIVRWVILFLVLGMGCFWWASVLRLIEAFMTAFRDIARNSFLLPEAPRAQPPSQPAGPQ